MDFLDTYKSQICDVCHKCWIKGFVASNDGNISARLPDGNILATPTGISKGEVTPESLVILDLDGNLIFANEGYKPSSEILMHLKCYKEREDIGSVVHVHSPYATSFAVAHKPFDMYNLIEGVISIGAVPLAPFALPSTEEVPNSIAPFLEKHDVMLLENHGVLALGKDIFSAYYRVESLELAAQITVNATILGGSVDISRENIDKLIDMRSKYGCSGKHPGYVKFS